MYSNFTIVLTQGKKKVSEKEIEVENYSEYKEKYREALDVYKKTVLEFTELLILCSGEYTVKLLDNDKKILKKIVITGQQEF